MTAATLVVIFGCLMAVLLAIFLKKQEPTWWEESWEEKQDGTGILPAPCAPRVPHTGHIPGWHMGPRSELEKRTVAVSPEQQRLLRRLSQVGSRQPEAQSITEQAISLMVTHEIAKDVDNINNWRALSGLNSGSETVQLSPKKRPPRKKQASPSDRIFIDDPKVLRTAIRENNIAAAQLAQQLSAMICHEQCSGPYPHSRGLFKCSCGQMEAAHRVHGVITGE